MRTIAWPVAALSLGVVVSLGAQRPFRIGPAVSSISLEDVSGTAHSFTSFGGSAALITGDEGETGLTIARYHDLSTDNRVRRLTLFSLDSYYYPTRTRGIAPFAATELGLARVTESALAACLSILTCPDTLSTTSQFALGFGLGVRVTVAAAGVAIVEGRFLEVPGSQIQALEARASASVAFGSVRKGAFLAGTVGPAVSAMIPISGPWARAQPLRGCAVPPRYQEDGQRRPRDRLRAPPSHRELRGARLRAQRHPVRARL